jgi:hypothetical protein
MLGSGLIRFAVQFDFRLFPDRNSGTQRATSAMNDYLAQVEKLRKDAAECALIRDLATDQAKRDLFDRLASHLTVLADQVEQAILQRNTRT